MRIRSLILGSSSEDLSFILHDLLSNNEETLYLLYSTDTECSEAGMKYFKSLYGKQVTALDLTTLAEECVEVESLPEMTNLLSVFSTENAKRLIKGSVTPSDLINNEELNLLFKFFE